MGASKGATYGPRSFAWSLERQIFSWLLRDIHEHGGTGRRLSKIHLNACPNVPDERFERAINTLVERREITIVTDASMGLYAIPNIYAEA